METRGGDSSDQDTDRGTAVEFVYRLTAADFEEALRARARRTPAGRAQVLMGPLMAAVAVAVLSMFQHATLPLWIVTLVVCVAAVSWGTVRGLRTMAQRMSSVMEVYGQCRMVADDRGAVTTGERASSSIDWSAFREYLRHPASSCCWAVTARPVSRYCQRGSPGARRRGPASGDPGPTLEKALGGYGDTGRTAITVRAAATSPARLGDHGCDRRTPCLDQGPASSPPRPPVPRGSPSVLAREWRGPGADLQAQQPQFGALDQRCHLRLDCRWLSALSS